MALVLSELSRIIIILFHPQRCRADMVDEVVEGTLSLESALWVCHICKKTRSRKNARKHVMRRHPKHYAKHIAGNEDATKKKYWEAYALQNSIPSQYGPRACNYCKKRITGTHVEHLFG